MPTPETAKAKWARKVKGKSWKAGVKGKGSEFCAGVAEFLGISSCNKEIESAYTAGVDAVSASMFDAAVAGKEEKWFRRYKEKMG